MDDEPAHRPAALRHPDSRPPSLVWRTSRIGRSEPRRSSWIDHRAHLAAGVRARVLKAHRADVAVVLLATTLFWAWLSTRAASLGSGWDVPAGKALNALARNPRPLLPPLLSLALVALLFIAAPIAALLRHDRPYARSAIAMPCMPTGKPRLPLPHWATRSSAISRM